MNQYHDLRAEYHGRPLTAATLSEEPLQQLEWWIADASAAGEPQPNAMALATVTANGQPRVRTVLAKSIDHGIVFYTNYQSAKGSDIAANGAAAGNFTWLSCHRQVRVSGVVMRTTEEESDRYFASRPLGAQQAAAASPQSQPIPDRSALESAFTRVQAAFPESVPRPSHWGGYRMSPERMEFWQGRSNRLHDRFEYVHYRGSWRVQRLAP